MLDVSQIHQSIEDFVEETGTDYIDAVLHFCEKYDIEVETVGSIIATEPNLVSKIQLEAENLHYIKRTNRLPI